MHRGTQFAVDWEERVNFDRLRADRLRKTHDSMRREGLDGLILFKPDSIRYAASVKGTTSYWWLLEHVVVPLDRDPIVFFSGTERDRVLRWCPWLKGRVRPAAHLEGVGAERDQLVERWAVDMKRLLADEGVGLRVGIDIANPTMIRMLQAVGLDVVDGESCAYLAREVKTQDEIEILATACTIADSALWHVMKSIEPGMRETDVNAVAMKKLRELGAESMMRSTTAAGVHSDPYYRLTGGSDKIIGPQELVIFDCIFQYMGYWSDTARTFLCGRAASKDQRKAHKDAYDKLYAGFDAIRPGNTTADVLKQWPQPDDMSRYTLDFGHGIGVSLHEAPWITPASAAHPMEFKPGQVLALETYAASNGHGCRLEENLVVTEKGAELLSRALYDERLL